ncbi:ABC transporter ATP-binding protein [Limobrevibacterium gyesilva]|uniref:ABC transporter ATP-binding protein n=1 Tax=Limobrevibacterium gyesilva TaxID=2991712 RepID=A0AA41YMM1_9PROT|nr:ABC transporter ATP-binding protein [Limobrevibacterium gyesilva]MCW3475515.1 ABC transporter ATP-binding protein [Limobrevibacterium gyesilva]
MSEAPLATGSLPAAGAPLLSVRDLRLTVAGAGRPLVDGVSFDVPPGGVVGIVGESGCGKSLTALSVLRLTAPAIGVSGQILFSGEDLLRVGAQRLRQVRGGEIAMVFQEPMTSLNSVFTVGDQIAEAIRTHYAVSRRAARATAIEFLAKVGVPSPATRVDNYPHQMSGGMRQRAMIAMALACRPKLLIADEPTTALDVTIQAQILDLLRQLRAEFGMAVLIITHDLGVVADLADEVVVMYAGRVVEQAPVATLFARPMHPYTEGLLRSAPPIDVDVERLPTIPGTVPAPGLVMPGCRFAPRCGYARAACDQGEPPLIPLGGGQRAACIRHRGYAP